MLCFFIEFPKPFEKIDIENVIAVPFIFIFYWHILSYLIQALKGIIVHYLRLICIKKYKILILF